MLSDALTAYRICAKAEGKSPKTVSWVTDAVRYFSEFLGDHDIEKVSTNDLRAFITALQQRKAFSQHRFTKPQEKVLSPESIRSYTRAIKTFFSFLEREELISANPVRKVKLPKSRRKVMPTFSERDLEKLLAQPDKKIGEGYRDYCLMLTLLDTGIRVSELCGLKVEGVDLYVFSENGTLQALRLMDTLEAIALLPDSSIIVLSCL